MKSRTRFLVYSALALACGWLLISRRAAPPAPSVADKGAAAIQGDQLITAQAAPVVPARKGMAGQVVPPAADADKPPLPERIYNGSTWDLVDAEGHKLTSTPFDFIYDFDAGGLAPGQARR